MKTSLIELDIKYYTFKELQDNFESFDIKTIGIQDSSKLAVSILLYRIRSLKQNPYRSFIDLKSYDKKRVPLVKYFIELSIAQNQIGNSFKSIVNIMTALKNYCNWLDKYNSEFPCNIESATSILHQYCLYMRQEVNNKTISSRTANEYTKILKNALIEIFSDEKHLISSGFVNIKLHSEKTKQVNNDVLQYFFRFYHELFTQLSDFIINKKSYPYEISLVDKKYQILPKKNNYILPIEYKLEEKDFTKTLVKNITINNKDFHSNERIKLAKLALKAYFMHFITITGINDSVASNIEYNKSFEDKDKSYIFRTTKKRAQNKTVEFRIEKIFKKEFDNFLLIRKFILSTYSYKYLFFSNHGKNANKTVAQDRGNFNSNIHEQMVKLIDCNLPRVTSKELRVSKISHILKNYSIGTASVIAQNLPSTLLKYYTDNNKEKMIKEFTNYFEKLNADVIFSPKEGKEIAVGQCKDYKNPNFEINPTKFKTNCSSFEGCLFCTNYGIHSDEKDIRKLLSLEFIINETKFSAKDENQFNEINQPILERIKSILQKLISHNKKNNTLINQIRKEVFEDEKLTSYFESKLRLYIQLGVII